LSLKSGDFSNLQTKKAVFKIIQNKVLILQICFGKAILYNNSSQAIFRQRKNEMDS